MKTRNKFIILILLACFFSIAIYYVVEKVKEVPLIKSDIERQSNIELAFTNNSYTIDDPKIIVNPYGVSPLTALVIFDTKDLTAPTVTIKGKDELTTYNHTFKPSKHHMLPIYGLYANTNNEIIITINEVDYKIFVKTEKLPKDFQVGKVVKKEPEFLNNDLYFVTPSSKGYTAAYDTNGDVRWYLTEDYSWDIQRLDNGHILIGSNRLMEEPYYTTGLIEMDLLGKIYFEYKLPGGYHHDVFELEDGNLLVATNNFKNNTVEDYVVEIDRNTGKIVKTIDLTRILPIDEGLNDYSSSFDWFHNNSVWYDAKTNSITLSGRHTDSVVNIDYDTTEINWIIGDDQNWSKDMKQYFFTPISEPFEWQWAQHAAMILPNGNVFIFDNGNNRSKSLENGIAAEDNYSRGVIYKINTSNMTISQVWQYGKERGNEFYSPYISDVDYLDKNNFLIHSGGVVSENGKPSNSPAGLTNENVDLKSYTVEVLDDLVVFELLINTNTYRAEKMGLYANDQYVLGKGTILGTFSETETTDNSLLLFNKDIEKIKSEKNINIYKETDRLVISGSFLKNDDVTIILDNMFSKKSYKMIISDRPYTAMCLDLYNDDDILAIKKYINSTNISGKYYIYIKINDVVYDTNQYVIF